MQSQTRFKTLYGVGTLRKVAANDGSSLEDGLPAVHDLYEKEEVEEDAAENNEQGISRYRAVPAILL